jgi:hypothetical protein
MKYFLIQNGGARFILNVPEFRQITGVGWQVVEVIIASSKRAAWKSVGRH